ncbi:MAG: hypothetical protein A4E58_00193 [Syntrophorhabdus sp. PtaB.Bin006]|nr:MAG: hypothetical protein A4E58_00193 [Syntrophorhabdus sp. PtaB.Bin006]
MCLKVVEGPDTQQGVNEAGVSNIDLRGFYEAFLHVCMVGLNLSYHERILQCIQVVSDCGCRYTEAVCDLTPVPELSVRMGKHCPEPSKLCGGHTYAELRDVHFEMGLDV